MRLYREVENDNYFRISSFNEQAHICSVGFGFNNCRQSLQRNIALLTLHRFVH